MVLVCPPSGGVLEADRGSRVLGTVEAAEGQAEKEEEEQEAEGASP